MRRTPPPEPAAGIPPDPIPHFVGREDEIRELREQLVQRKRVVIDGLSGVGKTQLAIRYLDQHGTDYRDGQFWLRAEQSSTLLSDLASLAWRLELPERELMEQEFQIEAVLRWLRQHEDWLLVVDSVGHEVVEDVVRLLPQRLPGHVLITSVVPHGLSRLSLGPLPSALAVRFLLERTGQSDEDAAQAIAAAVGNLPLALEQAAAYLIENPQRGLAGYAELLRTRMAELLREGRPYDHLPVATTWDLSFRRIEQARPAAADLLRLCAFLAADDIPIEVLHSARDKFPKRLGEALADDLEWDRTLAAVRGYSLAGVQGDRLRVHQLVQWAIRESLSAGGRRRWELAAIRFVITGWRVGWERPVIGRLHGDLMSHAAAMSEWLADADPQREAMARLLTRVSAYFRERAYEGNRAVAESPPGPSRPDSAASPHLMAPMHAARGEPVAELEDVARAVVGLMETMEGSLAILEEALDSADPDSDDGLEGPPKLRPDEVALADPGPILDHLFGALEKALGRASKHSDEAGANPWLERFQEIVENVLGPEHPDTAGSRPALESPPPGSQSAPSNGTTGRDC